MPSASAQTAPAGIPALPLFPAERRCLALLRLLAPVAVRTQRTHPPVGMSTHPYLAATLMPTQARTGSSLMARTPVSRTILPVRQEPAKANVVALRCAAVPLTCSRDLQALQQHVYSMIYTPASTAQSTQLVYSSMMCDMPCSACIVPHCARV
jgi:hypothetical protein